MSQHIKTSPTPTLLAAAVGGLAAAMEGIESDIEKLIAGMRASINEADSFLKTVPK